MKISEIVKQAKNANDKSDLTNHLRGHFMDKGASEFYAELDKIKKEAQVKKAAVNPREATAKIQQVLSQFGAGITGKGVGSAWRETAKKQVPQPRALGIIKRKPKEVDRSLIEHIREFAKQAPVRRAAASYAVPIAGAATVYGQGRKGGELSALRKQQ